MCCAQNVFIYQKSTVLTVKYGDSLAVGGLRILVTIIRSHASWIFKKIYWPKPWSARRPDHSSYPWFITHFQINSEMVDWTVFCHLISIYCWKSWSKNFKCIPTNPNDLEIYMEEWPAFIYQPILEIGVSEVMFIFFGKIIQLRNNTIYNE